MNKAVFLDRDGTINIEKNYLYKEDEFVFIEGAAQAIKILHEMGYKVIVITNQAGVARGYYTEDDVIKLHHYLDAELRKHHTHIDAYYYCPHHPEGVIPKYSRTCHCRKPNTGMIDQAVADFEIDLKESILIGDKETDILTGKNAGVKYTILVRSGHLINEAGTEADAVYDDLLSFARVGFQDTIRRSGEGK
ncbi:D-glycero-beta-D-manno-heptose 1,7-bisphosphate 7-phosphatase [Dehalobacter sp. TeCB1]|uniref:D-glycero-beta-D-manno-heptose 1,7-bisphosphate 7-phosphatase n=1 Tax=Dehalobacter sp. TeCB1 TaxID=1843715 RepID=UPI00083ACD8A|nr:D-glycero-beta-D-manno-heptose 1,7-bisphosphate 7-phosphatase [Dehalobacter sp. TeCB1]OCZ49445.1 D,D-heptose 1,7-bisphosphate phosphatase [Dehalobacter sp. TeCB1]